MSVEVDVFFEPLIVPIALHSSSTFDQLIPWRRGQQLHSYAVLGHHTTSRVHLHISLVFLTDVVDHL